MRGIALICTLAVALTIAGEAFAQCPDGTPPPCRAVPRPEPRPAEEPDTELIDSTTALVVPLNVVGVDTTLRQLAATFAAVVAENMTVGDVRARPMPELAELLLEDRATEARRRNAGAIVDGTLIKIGPNVRATVRLVNTSGRELATTTVTGTPDSLLSLADQASVVLLKEWWRRQPGKSFRGGLNTTSLPALRHYISGMLLWRRGARNWRGRLDSATQYDSTFLMPWVWLALPRERQPALASVMSMFMPQLSATADRAREQLRRLTNDPAIASGRDMFLVPSIQANMASTGAIPPPLPAAAGIEQLFATHDERAEPAYVSAVAARVATLAGHPESLAVAVTYRALEVDTAFQPTWSLLSDLLVDTGDSTAARDLQRRRFGGDSTPQAQQALQTLNRRLELRFARSPVPFDEDDDYQMLLMPWHRWHALEASYAGWRKRLAELQLGPQATLGFDLMLLLPLHIARGRLDSALAIPERLRQAQQAAPAPPGLERIQRVMVALNLGNMIPPDTAFFPPIDSVTLDSALTMMAAGLDSMEVLMRRMMPQPGMIEMMRGMVRRRMVTGAWLAGVLAVQRGDLATAGSAAAALDTLAAADTLSILPLALGLKAEIALARDSTAIAEQLLGAALTISVVRAPVRYRWLLARHLAAQGQPELARRMAHSITMASQLHQPEHFFYYAPALKLEAEALEQLDRRDEAIDAYERFVDLRYDADSIYQPEVGDVHLTLARLRLEEQDAADAWHHVLAARERSAEPSTELLQSLRDASPEPRLDSLFAPGSVDVAALAMDCPAPQYPDTLEESHANDVVVAVRFVADRAGRLDPSSLEIARRFERRVEERGISMATVTRTDFDQAALEVLRGCRFRPAITHGQRVRSMGRHIVTFEVP